MSTWTIGPRRLVSAFFVAATTLPTQVFAQDPAPTPPVPAGADAVLERLRQMEERLDARTSNYRAKTSNSPINTIA